MYGSLTALNGISFYFHILVLIVYTVIALVKKVLPDEKIAKVFKLLPLLHNFVLFIPAFICLVLFV